MPINEALDGRVYPAIRAVGNVAARTATAALKAELDGWLRQVDRAALVATDPVQLVRAYDDPDDQEVAGLVVAMLAYGRVASIRTAAGGVLEALGPSPGEAVDRGRRAGRLRGFVYRFQKDDDLPRFLRAVGRVRRRYGTLGRAFADAAAAVDAGCPGRAGRGASSAPEHTGLRTYVEAMDGFVARIQREVRGPLTYGLKYMFPRTRGQGAAKRLCLYLRWMVRPDDGIDLGTWHRLGVPVDPARLVMPLDTHIARIGRYLDLTRRASNDLKTALEITAALRQLAPEDPLRYDMALCHLGISGACPQRRVEAICAGCGLRRVCRLGLSSIGAGRGPSGQSVGHRSTSNSRVSGVLR